MQLSRRALLGALGALGVAVSPGVLGACGAQTNFTDRLTLWMWLNSCSPDLLASIANGIPGTNGVKFRPDVIGGDFKSKLLTTLAGRSHVPDLTFINADIATYFPNANQFVDLYTMGARKHQKEFLPFKWNFGVTPGGQMIGYPMDTGPTALFYRRDIFDKAGLPTEPHAVAAAVPTWDKYLELGQELRKVGKGIAITPTISALYTQVMAQSAKQYVTPDGQPIYAQDHVRRAWDLAVKAHQMKVSNNAQQSTDQTAALSNGKTAAQVNAVWWVVAGPEQLAPNTKGNWQVCPAPGGAGNYGGSFVSITKYCKNPEAAWKFIEWLENEKNEVRNLSEMFLFPSRYDALASDAISKPYKFFGGQPILEQFAAAAKKVPLIYYSPYDSIISTPINDELTNVEATGKNPDRAWKDAMSQIKRELGRVGVV
jgi:cellobiose transport system substrate-binding protein